MLYLFSSNSRDLYLKDVLNILALPERAQYQFRYERRRVEDELWNRINNNPDQFKTFNQDALIVFVLQPIGLGDQRDEKQAIKFFPIRKTSVKSISIVGEILICRLEVKEYVNWVELGNDHEERQDQLTQIILGTLWDDQRPPRKYISSGNESDTAHLKFADPDSQESAWQLIVSDLSNIPIFKHTVFYRIAGIQQFYEPFYSKAHRSFWQFLRQSKEPVYKVKDIKLTEILPDLSGYPIKEGSTNFLFLDFFHGQDLSNLLKDRSLIFDTDRNYLSYQPKPVPLPVKYDRKPIPLIISSFNQDVVTSLDIHIDKGNKGQEVNSGPNVTHPFGPEVIRSPEISLLLRINYNRLMVHTLLILLALSQFIIAFSGNTEELLENIQAPQPWIENASTISLLLSIIGPTFFFTSLF